MQLEWSYKSIAGPRNVKGEKTMRRKSILSIALVVGAVLISLVSFNSTVSAQQGSFFVADSGVITLGPNQKLRVIATTASDNQSIAIKFRRCTLVQQTGVFTVDSSQISQVMLIAPNQARFFDVVPDASGAAIRARVGSKRADFVVTFQIINITTGEIQSYTNGGVEHEDSWDNN